MKRTIVFVIILFVIIPIVFSIIYSFNHINPTVIISYAIITLIGLLIGFVIELAINDFETNALRKEKIKKLENQYNQLLSNTSKTQQNLDAFRIYCNSLTEL